jgi:hypothetical protein
MTISTIKYKKYRTSDGKDFDNYTEAVNYETEDSFHEWYNNDKELFSFCAGHTIESALMLSWIKDHETFLYNFLHRRHYLLSKEE